MLCNLAGVLAVAGLAAATPHKPCSTESASPTSINWVNQYTASASADVEAAAATAKTSSPTSKVKGKAFDRIAIVYFENTDYNKAVNDPNFHFFADKGLTLSNYFAVTHPSQPNYVAGIAGDHFGMQNDDFTQIPANVSTVIDLLEDAGISWGAYQEDMPYSGYEGYHWLNPKTGANDYMRKHNPPVIFNSVVSSEQRLSQIKNLSMIDTAKSQFHIDLKENKLPQWMFITPNMTSDAHDSDITVAGSWLRLWLEPLLDDKHFMDNTIVLLTFDENETYVIQNNIFSIVLGDALPEELRGQSDDSFYNHYTEIATVEANWDLPTLGRWDVGANPLAFVAQKTGEKLREWDPNVLDTYYWNQSYAGAYNEDGGNHLIPAPITADHHSFNGREVAKFIRDMWKNSKAPCYYKDTIENNDGLNPPAGYAM